MDLFSTSRFKVTVFINVKGKVYILDALIHHHLSFFTFLNTLFVVYFISPAVTDVFTSTNIPCHFSINLR